MAKERPAVVLRPRTAPAPSEDAIRALEAKVEARQAMPAPGPAEPPTNSPPAPTGASTGHEPEERTTASTQNVTTSERSAAPARNYDGRLVQRKGRLRADGSRTAGSTLLRLTVYVQPDIGRALDVAAAASGRDRSSIIGEALTAWLAGRR